MTGVLLKAVSAGRPRQVRLLLDSGISLESQDSCGQTPLIRAVFVDHGRTRDKLLQMLLRAGAKVSHQDLVGRDALSWACLYGRERDVSLLLQYADVDLDINQRDVNGQTCLFHAVTSGNAAVVKLIVEALLRYDLSVDVANKAGISPLMQAIKLGHDVCASILIRQGHATAGINMKGPADVNTWVAKSCHLSEQPQMTDLPNCRSPSKQISFPPIIPLACLQTMQYQENRALQHRIVTPHDSDDDSTYGSEASFYTDDSVDTYMPPRGVRPYHVSSDDDDQYRSRVPMVPPKPTSPMSLRSVSLTSSTEAVVDSNDDDVDNFSSTVEPPCEHADLTQLYQLYEQQHSAAYRPGAVPPLREAALAASMETLTDVSSCTDTTTDTHRHNRKSTPKWSDLRKTMLQKSLARTRISQDSSHGNEYSRTTSSSDSESSEKLFVARKAPGNAPRKATLPKISSKWSSLLSQACDKGARDTVKTKNYSNI